MSNVVKSGGGDRWPAYGAMESMQRPAQDGVAISSPDELRMYALRVCGMEGCEKKGKASEEFEM